METENKDFLPLLQGSATNRLIASAIEKSRPWEIDDLLGTALLQDRDIRVTASAPITLTVSAKKLLDYLTAAFTAANGYGKSAETTLAVPCTVKEYAEALGLRTSKASLDKLRRNIKRDLDLLFALYVEWRGRNGDTVKMRLFSSTGNMRGGFCVSFTAEFASYLRSNHIMQYPAALLRVDGRERGAYYIGRKLALHDRVNHGKSHKISIRALLDACPSLPSYERIKNTDRHYKRKIIKPLENALYALSDMLECAEIIDKDGGTFPPEAGDNACERLINDGYVRYALKQSREPAVK